MDTTTTSIGRRLALAAASAGAAALAVTSVAYACTAVMGDIKVCSPSTGTCSEADWETDRFTSTNGRGVEGSTVKVWAGHLKKKELNPTYGLFAGLNAVDAQGEACHKSSQLMKTPAGAELNFMKTNKHGELDRDRTTAGAQPYKAALPDAGSVAGEYPYEICAREISPVPEQTASQHVPFTVVVL